MTITLSGSDSTGNPVVGPPTWVEPDPGVGSALPLGVLRAPRTVWFGPGRRRRLGTECRALGETALVCTDERFAATAAFADLVADLRRRGVRPRLWTRTEPELPVSGIERCRSELADAGPVDVVVGIGGGSCLDMAKAMALVLAHGGAVPDYFGENAVPGPVLPIVAVPTTGGTGSEVSPVCVVNDDSAGAGAASKMGISSPFLIPSTAICDPELTLTCPATLTASVGADALTHLVESFTAARRRVDDDDTSVFVGKNEISDHYARWGLRLLGDHLVDAVRSGDDLAARTGTLLAAHCGGYALGAAGTAAAHALQYPLGTLTHTPHGVGVGVLLRYVMRYNLAVRGREFAEIATLLGVPTEHDSTGRALAGVAAVDDLLDRIGIPRTIKELGVTTSDLTTLAVGAMRSTRLVQNNPRPVDETSLLTIARAAYAGDLSVGGLGLSPSTPEVGR